MNIEIKNENDNLYIYVACPHCGSGNMVDKNNPHQEIECSSCWERFVS